MQAGILKKILSTAFILMVVAGVLAQNAALSPVQRADSLFVRKDYTQALAVYENSIGKNGVASPAMLLKMAFVKESLGDYTQSLYYLNLYQRQNPRQQIALKMSELAAKHTLRGYEYNDWDFFLIFYQRYYPLAVIALAGLGCWLLAGMIRRKLRGKFVSGRHGMALFVFLLGILVALNLQFNDRQAIVARDYSYLMDAPSAGANLVRIVRKGHRLPIRGEHDIWLRTGWLGKTAYVRKQNVWLVE